MQRRHRHFIRPTSKVTYPQAIIAVCADGKLPNPTSVESPPRLDLVKWTAQTAILSSGMSGETRSYLGVNSESFWCLLDNILRHQNNTWIVSWRAMDVMTLLEMWAEIESGRAYLVRADPRESAKAKAHAGGRSAGYFVCENPPTIVVFKRKNLPGSVTWIDMRNYGFSEWIEIASESISPRLILGTLLDIIEFLQTQALGSLRVTAGSQSLSSWKYRFLKHSIHVNTNEAQTDLARSSIIGGRVECFRLGQVQGPVTQFDVNSLYPSVYSRHTVPIRLRTIRCNPSDGYIASAVRGKNCIARVLVETNTPNVPKRDGRGTYFPVGRIATTVCFPELEIILDTCKSCRITEIATYDCEQALSEYANAMYALRIDARAADNRARETFIKAMLVSLPGKFGQRLKVWEWSENQVCAEPWSTFYRRDTHGRLIRCRSVGWSVQEERDLGLAPEAVPEIAAWVNSWGRRILWELIQNAGQQNVYYCDTDSAWVNSEGAARLVHKYGRDTGEMGSIRVAGKYDKVDFRGIKHYVADGKTTCAGGRIARGVASAMDESGVRIEGPAESIARGRRPGRIVASTQSARMSPYTTGRVQPDLSVLPLICEDW